MVIELTETQTGGQFRGTVMTEELFDAWDLVSRPK